jgi:FixJ family two-component response regulator
VEHHREHLMLKMQARSMAELVTMALLCGVRDLHV